MKIFALIDHASPDQRHQMLAANQSANPANVRLVSDQIAAVAIAPHGAFDKRRHRLPMAPQNAPRAVDKQQRVIDRVHAAARIHFIAADHHVRVSFRRCMAKPLGVFAGNQNRVVVKPDSHRQPILQPRFPSFAPIGIARKPGLGESESSAPCPAASAIFSQARSTLLSSPNRRAEFERRRLSRCVVRQALFVLVSCNHPKKCGLADRFQRCRPEGRRYTTVPNQRCRSDSKAPIP